MRHSVVGVAFAVATALIGLPTSSPSIMQPLKAQGFTGSTVAPVAVR